MPNYLDKLIVKCSCIALGIILVVAIATTLSLPKENTKNGDANKLRESSNLNSGYANEMIIASSTGFWRFDLENKIFNQDRLINFTGRESIRTFDLTPYGVIIWSRESNTSMIDKTFDGIVHTKKWKPQALALDCVTKKYYIIENSTDTLIVYDTVRGIYSVMLPDLVNPFDIILDIPEGLMFISQQSKSILRANMDGTSLTTIVEDPGVSFITLDRKTKKIFWASDDSGVKMSDYNGYYQKTLAVYLCSFPTLFKGIAFSNGRLFWILPGLGDHSSTLNQCELSNDACSSRVIYPIPFENPRILKAYPDPSEETINDHPCLKKNGDCAEICVVSSSRTRSCACKLGWKLNSDSKTCRKIIDYILFEKDKSIQG